MKSDASTSRQQQNLTLRIVVCSIKSMRNIADRKFTIREAVNVLKKSGFKLLVTTVQKWQQAGVFMPSEPAKPRDPRGSLLSYSDVIYLAVLHVLFSLGTRFGDIRAAKLKSVSPPSDRNSRDLLHEVFALSPEAFILFRGVDGFDQTDRDALAREISLRRRPVQAFFEITRYHCVLCSWFRPLVRWRHLMLAPCAGESEFNEVRSNQNVSMTHHEVAADIIIDIQPFHKAVLHTLHEEHYIKPFWAEEARIETQASILIENKRKGSLSEKDFQDEWVKMRSQLEAAAEKVAVVVEINRYGGWIVGTYRLDSLERSNPDLFPGTTATNNQDHDGTAGRTSAPGSEECEQT